LAVSGSNLVLFKKLISPSLSCLEKKATAAVGGGG